MIKIELWSDFACPFCYIGKTRFEKALSRFPHKDLVEVTYKAYQLNPNAPKKMVGSAAESFAKGHGTSVEAAKRKFSMFVTAAKEVGLEYNYDIIQMTNTFDAHRVAKWAATFHKEEVITARFMKAYFTDGLNLSDKDTLLNLVEEVGLNVEDAKKVLNSNDYSDVVTAQINEGRQVGVQGVPFFVLNRKYGVSGAQAEDYFYQVLETLYEETKGLESIEGSSEGHTCDDETCSI
jgi:predicted DsbA family dithiol-disulfide isomerase